MGAWVDGQMILWMEDRWIGRQKNQRLQRFYHIAYHIVLAFLTQKSEILLLNFKFSYNGAIIIHLIWISYP